MTDMIEYQTAMRQTCCNVQHTQDGHDMVPIEIRLGEVMKHTDTPLSSDVSERVISIAIKIASSITAHSPERINFRQELGSISNNVDELDAAEVAESASTASTTERRQSIGIGLVDDNSVQEEDGGRKKKRKRGVPRDGEPRPRLKCPYSLREPGNHTRASCRGFGFADMGKMKDHLKRVHQKPRQCPRCWDDFVTEDTYQEHLNLIPACPERSQPQDDRLSAAQLHALNFNRVPYATMSVEEKWKALYHCLFPHEIDIPSPYDEHGLGQDFDRLLAQQLERKLSELSRLVNEENHIELHETLVDIIRECRTIAGFKMRDSDETQA